MIVILLCYDPDFIALQVASGTWLGWWGGAREGGKED